MKGSRSRLHVQALLGVWMRTLCFNRVDVIDAPPAKPAGAAADDDGAVLYLCLHRNGAVDGSVYNRAIPNALFMVSAQLQRIPLGRWLFPGIPVTRGKDRARGIAVDNDSALAACVDHLAAGGQLAVFPEGTSTLGPAPLPFKPGAALIAAAVLARGIALRVMPLAVQYEAPTDWQSRAEVSFGPSRVFDAPTSADALIPAFNAMLACMAIRFSDEGTQVRARKLAYAGTLGTEHTYTRLLRRFSENIPATLDAALSDLEADLPALTACHQGLPLVPVQNPLLYWAAWLLLTPLMICFVIVNAPPLLIAETMARRLPDDRNVMCFWRMAGLMASWPPYAVLALVLAAYWGGVVAVLGYSLVSLIGRRLVYRYRKISVSAWNALYHPKLRLKLLKLHRQLLAEVSA